MRHTLGSNKHKTILVNGYYSNFILKAGNYFFGGGMKKKQLVIYQPWWTNAFTRNGGFTPPPRCLCPSHWMIRWSAFCCTYLQPTHIKRLAHFTGAQWGCVCVATLQTPAPQGYSVYTEIPFFFWPQQHNSLQTATTVIKDTVKSPLCAASLFMERWLLQKTARSLKAQFTINHYDLLHHLLVHWGLQRPLFFSLNYLFGPN